MPITVLAALVVFGIAGIAVLTVLFGFNKRRSFIDAEDAGRAWLREFPDLEPRDITLSQDGCHALVQTDQGAGIVWSMGADSAARLLTGARVKQSVKGLDLRLRDYTAPRIRAALTPDQQTIWLKRIKDTP